MLLTTEEVVQTQYVKPAHLKVTLNSKITPNLKIPLNPESTLNPINPKPRCGPSRLSTHFGEKMASSPAYTGLGVF